MGRKRGCHSSARQTDVSGYFWEMRPASTWRRPWALKLFRSEYKGLKYWRFTFLTQVAHFQGFTSSWAKLTLSILHLKMPCARTMWRRGFTLHLVRTWFLWCPTGQTWVGLLPNTRILMWRILAQLQVTRRFCFINTWSDLVFQDLVTYLQQVHSDPALYASYFWWRDLYTVEHDAVSTRGFVKVQPFFINWNCTFSFLL